MFTITPQLPADGPGIEALLDRAFGAERTAKPSYRLRDGVAADPRLGLVARGADGALLATIRFWPIDVVRAGRARPALLLGPLAVEPALKGRGIGKALLRAGVEAAARDGHALVLLVGDPAYYAPFGFVPAAAHGFVMPGEDPARLQALELAPGAARLVAGAIEKISEVPGNLALGDSAEPHRPARDDAGPGPAARSSPRLPPAGPRSPA